MKKTVFPCLLILALFLSLPILSGCDRTGETDDPSDGLTNSGISGDGWDGGVVLPDDVWE